MSSAGTSNAAPLTSRPAAPLAPPAELPTQRNKVKVRFCLGYRVNYGENIVVVGGHPDLGSWILADAVPLSWSDGDMWHATIDLPAGSVFEYKYVVVGNGGHAIAWQQGNNSVLALRQADDVIEVFDNWTCAPGAQVVAAGSAPVTRENRLLSWATELEAQVASQRQELRRARMELVAAQEEARLAREESRKLKLALTQSEAERMASMAHLKQADTVNKVLQTQLAETTSSFAEALETALDLLTAANANGNGKRLVEKTKEKTSTAAAAATPAATPAATLNGSKSSPTTSPTPTTTATTTTTTMSGGSAAPSSASASASASISSTKPAAAAQPLASAERKI